MPGSRLSFLTDCGFLISYLETSSVVSHRSFVNYQLGLKPVVKIQSIATSTYDASDLSRCISHVARNPNPMPLKTTPTGINDVQLKEFEDVAVEAASKAGSFVLERITSIMEIKSKTDRPGRDLVTDVDRDSQVIISDIITSRFPDHQFLGEEDQTEEVDSAADFVWAVDPIDGTANYVNGSMTHAVSVALMHRGSPIVGAIWSPWPTSSDGGIVVHARLNGGTKRDGEAMQVLEPSDEFNRPVSGRLSALPGNARSVFKFDNKMRGHAGDVRVTGSAAHEMSSVGTGLYQFAIGGVAAVWDFAAAVVIVQEAGGEVMILAPDGSWRDFQGWSQPYANTAETFKHLRDWRGIMLASHPKTLTFIAENVRFRRPSQIGKLWRRGPWHPHRRRHRRHPA